MYNHLESITPKITKLRIVKDRVISGLNSYEDLQKLFDNSYMKNLFKQFEKSYFKNFKV